jgi:hypothetical protein
MKRGCDVRCNFHWARKLWAGISPIGFVALRQISELYKFSIPMGDVLFLGGGWYVTHLGLIRLAYRKSCTGIRVQVVRQLCDVVASRWVFKATVYRSPRCKGFVGYGDANPSNVSPVVHGAEMRVAETRAVNRALRKAYGIGLCSVDEIGSSSKSPQSSPESRKLPPQPTNQNYGGPKVRDRLCHIIRQHQLDPTLVKVYATDFCGTKTLREATREQVENFVAHLADWAEKDRNALLCQLNSYGAAKEGAA